MNRGICLLSNIPVRKHPDGTSEMVSMLLFGETYRLLQEEKEWYRIIIDYDQYEGWISKKQVSLCDSPASKQIENTCYPNLTASSPKGNHFILSGSSLPLITNNSFALNGQIFQLDQTILPKSFKDLESLAKQYLGTPYLWGGRSPFGIDCSGFTQVVFKLVGIPLKRDAYQQAEQGELVDFRESAQMGDLAFFDNAEGRITHVGIMLSPNEIIHASGYVRIDAIDNYGIMNLETKEYSHKLRIIKRMSSSFVQ